MTDITELAQRNELLIANGQLTADLLRHLADNEIDSDYFAVVSECESYGQETDAELSITEFAIRAAGYVDELVEALEKAQQVDEELCKLLPPGAEYMDPPDGGDVTPLEGVRRMVADYRQRIAELESRTVKLVDCDYGAVQHMSGGSTDYCHGFVDGTQNAIRAITAAGIKVEAE
ncbi:hypothetical protein [Klebsiella pneumoniae]|uniref:hypothetical protein n=1 Tax=Klebsiella pneumoniae TaxID=573 RepID=UPI001E32AE41|nr:hypothetical protein [Klebsiella pneumoniae]